MENTAGTTLFLPCYFLRREEDSGLFSIHWVELDCSKGEGPLRKGFQRRKPTAPRGLGTFCV
jgi:hypothetical protein